MGNHTCRWDTDCPGLQKCCNFSGESVCTSPIPAVGEGYFNLLIEVKLNFEQTELDLMNHLRFLHSVVTGALHALNSSLYHIHTQRDGEHKTVSELVLGTRPPTTLMNISRELQKVLLNIDEVCHLETKDINECEHAELNSCSLKAICSNTDGSHNCTCQKGFTDRDSSRRGRDCREVTTAVVIPEIRSGQSSKATSTITDLEESTPTAPSSETPSCSPLSVTNLTIAKVTSTSFQVTWAAASSEDQTVTVRVQKEGSIVNEVETQEMDWTVTGLEPGVLYIVEVHWQSYEGSFTKELKVKTAALLLDGRVRIKNFNFTENLRNTSSSEFKQFTELWLQEVEKSLPPTIHCLYQNGKILVRIKSLSYGSNVVNFEIVIDQGIKLSVWNVSSALITSLYNSSVFEYDHNSTSISDVNECTSPTYNDCSPHAMCKNIEGSYTCICSERYRDVNPAWPGRSCEETTMTVLTPTSTQRQSSTVFASAMITYVNGPGFPAGFPYSEVPLCVPSPVVNLTVSKVTGRSFQVTWTTDTSEEQIFIVQVLRNKITVNETETQEMEWTAPGLEPGTEYTVSVMSRACDQESIARELNVKTAPFPVNNLTVSKVTSTSFHVTWRTEDYEEQTFIVQVLKNDSIVNETATLELEWTVLGLEPETEYTVSVISRACEDESTAAELSVKTGTIFAGSASTHSPIQSGSRFISTVAIYLNSSRFPPGFPYAEVPPCSPSPVINLTASNMTTGSFHLTWTTDTYEEQIFIVQVLQNDSIVNENETLELEWTVSGLEPETEYTVSVISRACEDESTAAELSVKTETIMTALSYTSNPRQSSTGVVSTMTIYPNTSGFPIGFAYTEMPPCSTPSPIINLTVYNITAKSFHITWTTDNYEEQIFIVQLLKNDSVVKETETLELSFTMSGLEPGTEYTVSVISRSCEQESIATELNLKTETTSTRAKRSAVSFVSSMTIYLNGPGFPASFPYSDVPPCSPSSVTKLVVSSVTSSGFQVTWTTDTSEEQIFVVQLLKNISIVSETETEEMEWTASGLESGTEYTVSIMSRVCEQVGIATELNVKTALSPTKAETEMSISNANNRRNSRALDQLTPNSVQTFASSSTQMSTVACVPSSITSLVAFNVTSNSLTVIWEADATTDQMFVVQLWKDNGIVVNAKTEERSWTESNLETGVLYTVRVISRLCGKESKAKVQEVKTAALILGGRTRITNLMFSEGLRNSSSHKFKTFTAQFITQILKSLPEYTAKLFASGKVKIVIKSLWEGSVKVDFQVVFDEEMVANVSEITMDLVSSLKNSSVFRFDPDSTDISDYNECISLDDNDCSLNAECINLEGSYTCRCSDSFVDVNPVRPGRNCRDPLVARTTVEAASQSIMVSCNLHEISVIMERSFLEEKQIPASSLYLGNLQCNGSIGNLTHVALKVGWTECGTQISNNETHTVVKTTLSNIPSSSTVSASAILKVPVNCTFDNSLLLTAGYTPNGMNTISLEGIGNYMANIETFSGNHALSKDSILTPEDEVSIQVSIDTSDSRAKLILAECWATPSNNSTSDASYTIIKTSCPVPESQTRISENGNSTSAIFTLKVFSFIDMPFVYIHCQTQVCLEVNGVTCQPSCNGSRSVKSAEVIAERTVSLGPLYRRYNNDGGPVVELDKNSSAVRAVVMLGILLCLTLVVITAVVVTLYTRWGRSVTLQPDGQNYQAFNNY
uniref:uromodulin-like 1 isoform X2 n=1 Tax=Pristiophorus japonicus TaxID=55135 RepID=UPI00398F7401